MDQTTVLLNTRQAARLLGVSPGTLTNWRWCGLGPQFIQVGPRAVRYALADLEEFVVERRRQTPMKRGGQHAVVHPNLPG